MIENESLRERVNVALISTELAYYFEKIQLTWCKYFLAYAASIDHSFVR